MVHIPNEERRARMGKRHALAPSSRVRSILEVAGAVGAIHATDPTTVFLSTWARVDGVDRSAIEAALYDERSVVRVMGMRRTLFVVPVATFPIVDVGAARDLADGERRRLVKVLSGSGVTPDPEPWLRRVEAATLDALATLGEATATQLAAEVPELKERLVMGAGRWATEVALSTRIVFLLATEGKIVRGRPRGTWLSSQWRWYRTEDWVGSSPHMTRSEARSALLRLYLGRFGPATERDLAWWTGWTKAATRAALEAVGAVDVDLDGGRGFVLPDDVDAIGSPEPWVALLPGLDATVMGWKERDWYLGPHSSDLFDTNGNAGPVVVVDGRVVGGWAQTAVGKVVYELLEDVGRWAASALDRRAEELTDWLGGEVPVPRFRSPLHRRLTA